MGVKTRKTKYETARALAVGQRIVIPVDEHGGITLRSFRAVVCNWGRRVNPERDYRARELEDGSFEVERRA